MPSRLAVFLDDIIAPGHELVAEFAEEAVNRDDILLAWTETFETFISNKKGTARAFIQCVSVLRA